jgi:hypothetical protein
MEFMGQVAIDQGGNRLNSYETRKNLTFGEAADWFTKAVEYVRSMVKNDPSIMEARVMIYDAATMHSVTAEPIDGVMFRQNGRELKVRPMNG